MGRLILLLALLAAGCQVTETSRPASTPPVARTSSAEQAWRVVEDGRPIGYVVRFQELDGGTFFSVRNPWQQDRGMIDHLGRAWAFRLHAGEPVRVGAGTVAQGAARILEASSECELIEVPVGSLAAPPTPAESE
jgi:hypothetical protein